MIEGLWIFIINHFNEVLKYYINVQSDEITYIYSDREDKENKLHIYYPNIIINKYHALTIRKKVINNILGDINNKYGLDSDTWIKIIDASVYKANGLRVLGQKKPHERCGYKINIEKSTYSEALSCSKVNAFSTYGNIKTDILKQFQLTSIRTDNNEVNILLNVDENGYSFLYRDTEKLEIKNAIENQNERQSKKVNKNNNNMENTIENIKQEFLFLTCPRKLIKAITDLCEKYNWFSISTITSRIVLISDLYKRFNSPLYGEIEKRPAKNRYQKIL